MVVGTRQASAILKPGVTIVGFSRLASALGMPSPAIGVITTIQGNSICAHACPNSAGPGWIGAAPTYMGLALAAT